MVAFHITAFDACCVELFLFFPSPFVPAAHYMYLCRSYVTFREQASAVRTIWEKGMQNVRLGEGFSVETCQLLLSQFSWEMFAFSHQPVSYTISYQTPWTPYVKTRQNKWRINKTIYSLKISGFLDLWVYSPRETGHNRLRTSWEPVEIHFLFTCFFFVFLF